MAQAARVWGLGLGLGLDDLVILPPRYHFYDRYMIYMFSMNGSKQEERKKNRHTT